MKKFILASLACTTLISFSPLVGQVEVSAATTNIATAPEKIYKKLLQPRLIKFSQMML